MRSTGIVLAACLLCAFAAVHSEEVQSRFCDDPAITEIDAELEGRLGLFPGYPGFLEARAWLVDGQEYRIEILCAENGAVVRKTLKIDEAGFAELRARVAEGLARTASARPVDQQGRYTLLTATTLYSLSLYGPLFAAATDMQDYRSIAATESIMGSAGFFVPFWLTRERRITESAASSYIYGTMIGAGQGALLMMLVNGERIGTYREVSGTVLAFSLAEGIGGYFLADSLGVPAGTVDSIAAGSLWGALWAFEGAWLMNVEDAHAFGGAMLAGSFAGMGMGYAFSAMEDYSRGDVIVQNDVAILGAFVPLALCDLFGNDNEKIFAGASLAGSLAGTYLGYRLVRGRDFTGGQGGLVSLGEYAGMLLGSGIVTFLDADHASIIPAIGGMVGFGVVYYLFRDAALPSPVGGSAWGFSVTPFVGAELPAHGAVAGTEPEPGVLRGLLRSPGIRATVEYRFD